MPNWNGRHGDFVHFSIMGYESPNTSDDNDSNWIRVRISAKNEQGEWSRTAGCMTTDDIRWFSQWFTKVTDGIVDNTISSYEPDLQLQYLATVEGNHRFAVRLSYGLGYPSPINKDNTSLVIIGISHIELKHTIAYFREVEKLYPRRGPSSNQPFKDLPEIELL